jgi:CDGSH-type Zn-finger protein
MSKPRITPMENGPYIVEGTDAVVRYTDGKQYPIEGKAALCRCGASKNKPFCDGAHSNSGFTSAKEPDRVPDQLEDIAGDGITIHDNRGLCAHAGRCTDGLPAVFRLGTEPWIAASAADAETIATTIQQCPSGALSYSINEQLYRDRGGDPAFALAPNGPYIIRGGAELADTELNAGGTTDHMTLCRCGASQNKPFCSGAHWNVRFDEDAPAQD